MLPKVITPLGEIVFYKMFNMVGTVFMLLFMLLQSSKFRSAALIEVLHQRFIRKKRSLWKHPAKGAFVLTLVFSLAALALLLELNDKFGDWFTNGNKNVYGNFTAWFIVFGCISTFLYFSPLQMLDAFSPALMVGLIFFKTACFFEGCCNGFEMQSFYFNQKTQRFEVPVQMIEGLLALILLVIILLYRRKTTRIGTVYPLLLTLFSISRFLTEFLRDDYPNVLGVLNAYQIVSIVFFVLGLTLLVLTFIFGRRWEDFFKKRNLAFVANQKKNFQKNNPSIRHKKRR